MSRKQELALKLNVLDSKFAKNQVLLQYYRRKRNQHIWKMKMLHLQQFHLALAFESSRVWSYSQETSFWEVDVQNMSDDMFKETFRMHRKTFDVLCKLLSPMAKTDCKFRKCIPLEKRIAIALYALKSTDHYLNIGKKFGVGKSTVCEIMVSFSETIWESMNAKYLPSNFITKENIQKCVSGFEKLGMPQCFGAVDGCHIEIYPSTNNAAEYRNSKGSYSMILLALVNHNHRFLYINVGSPGKWNNSEIFQKSRLPYAFSGELLKDHKKCINGIDVPIFIIGDSSFLLSEYLMKPYPFSIGASDPEIMFSKKLLHCHKVVEETFEQLKARFGRIGKGSANNIRNASKIIQACCLLHNFLKDENDDIKDEWIGEQQTFEDTFIKRQPDEFESLDFNPRADEIRNCLANYMFNLNGNRNV